MAAVTVGTALVGVLLLGGLAFTAVAVVGIVRLPDVYARAHATSKSETLGALLGLAAAGVAYDSLDTTVKLAALAVFLLATSPTAAHAIVRSADDQGVEPVTGPAAADGTRSVGGDPTDEKGDRVSTPGEGDA